ncbi:signal peptidase I [Candidatus Woesearchaeota archaeon]|jgi:hypothetical protein|nr:signal peptidase I [Candidatus Woesearchaeota archaeon]MBT4387966.1 signal peptidase I [Candidatus Woesearchaeota archaeon]MBT4595310.1 signal peptidase I [Candidatus Woesearchaeota archaeon]MBT5741492.1 signal peptidase I [Candidatus Woesearchaeota archaeon]MBT6505634.1 signal peptidase I [Candidatus Woesearchaeota archaeon]
MKKDSFKVIFTFLSLILFFSLGFISSNIFFDSNNQNPLSLSATIEKNSPSNWINEDDLIIENDGIKIKLNNYIIARFSNTNSMDPFLDENSNAIEIKPENADQINVGDIVSYRVKGEVNPIIHRIIDIDYDENGYYYILKGDNNNLPDPYKVRFNQIGYVLVGILY